MLQASSGAWLNLWRVSLVSSWPALALCLARGLPVLAEAPRFLLGLETSPAPEAEVH